MIYQTNLFFEGCLTKSCQTENSPRGVWPPILAPSVYGSPVMLCDALTDHTNSPTEGPLDNSLTSQMTGFRCAGCTHAEKQTRQRGVSLACCKVWSVGLFCFDKSCQTQWETKDLELQKPTGSRMKPGDWKCTGSNLGALQQWLLGFGLSTDQPVGSWD